MELVTLIEQYYKNNTEKNKLTKEVKADGEEIKAALIAQGLKGFNTESGLSASITEKENEDFNEEFAIEILRKNLKPEQLKNVIKTREYIDDDALEALTYNKEFDPVLLQPAITKKEPTITLRVKELK